MKIVKVHAPELFTRKPPPQQTRHDAYLKANIGIDPILLAIDCGVTEAFIRRRQRKLGLRLCVQNPRKADRLAEARL
jgi:hypothetical protein